MQRVLKNCDLRLCLLASASQCRFYLQTLGPNVGILGSLGLGGGD